jgi:hypothetical protein
MEHVEFIERAYFGINDVFETRVGFALAQLA